MFNNQQKGVSLIITFFILTIILSIILSISAILYSEIKIIRNIGDSVAAFYLADSGVEKVLYYNNKVLLSNANKGLCTMCKYDENENACPLGNDDSWLNCLDCQTQALDAEEVGCDTLICKNCEVTFYTDVLEGEKRYKIIATVTPNSNVNFTDFVIESSGNYKNVKRAVRLFTTIADATGTSAPIITDAYAVRLSETLDIYANVYDPDGIDVVYGLVYYGENGETIDTVTLVGALGCNPAEEGGCQYEGSWNIPSEDVIIHHVEIFARDLAVPPNGPNEAKEDNVPIQ